MEKQDKYMIEIKNPKERTEQDFDRKAPKPSHIQLFRDLAARPDNTRSVDQCLLILSTPRCGSTLFSEALNSCGRLGRCDEWLNYDYFYTYLHLFGGKFKLTDYVDFIERKTPRNTGVFCLKMHVGQLIEMNQDPDLGLEAINANHVVYLYRKDKIAQAVSLCKADVSQQFRSYEKVQAQPTTDRQGISSALCNIIINDCFAREYLMASVDVSYAYEDFRQLSTESTRADRSYSEVLEALGKAHPSRRQRYQFTAGDLKKQANGQSRKVAADFQSYILGEKE